MNDMQLVAFRLGREEYAIPVDRVREIINYIPVTKLPEAPPYLEGIIDVRGKIVPVVNFSVKAGLSVEQGAKQIVIVEAQNKEIGLTVDTVTEVIQAVQENFCHIDSVNGAGQSAKIVYKLQDRIIILLDLEKVLPGRPSTE